MAKKRKSTGKSSGPGKAAARQPAAKKPKAGKSAAPTVPGGGWAFTMGLTGTLSLASFFMPWYNTKNTIIYGYQAMTSFDTLPKSLRAGYDAVDGPMFMYLVVLTAIVAVVVGFAWPKIVASKGRVVTSNISMAIGAAALIEGLILLLILLNMKAKPSVESTGIGAAVLLLVLGVVSLAFVRAVDADEHHTKGILPGGEWAALLLTLGVSTAIHYQLICYSLVPKAPDALNTTLRTFK